jgi:uncharacterized protein
MASLTRILFATDLHGSRRTFLKFLNALKLYKANVGIIGGDLTGKVIVPIVTTTGGQAVADFNGQNYDIRSEDDLKRVSGIVVDSGYYPMVAPEEDARRLRTDSRFADETFHRVTSDRLKEWIQLAKERLDGTGIRVFITGGNDDYLELDDVLAASDSMIFAEGKIEMIDSQHEMISSGYANITPWKCPRDVPEEELYAKIDDMSKRVSNMETAVFNLHCPPIDTSLDRCTKLDTSFNPPRPLIGEETAGGSTAVRKAIETYQPLLSLHGHIHESRGIDKIGRTICLNPGSEYSEGILRTVLVNLSSKKVESFQFLSG